MNDASDGPDVDSDDEGWPCLLSGEAEAVLLSPAAGADVFSAIVALTVDLNRTCGDVPGATRDPSWPEQGRVGLGPEGEFGMAEYVVLPEADPPHIVITRIQLL